MKIEFIEKNGKTIARLVSDAVEIKTVQDALDLMGNCYNKKASGLIVEEKNIAPEFFDLKTGLAGEILQKFVNYGFRIAIVGDFSKFPSKNFQDFLYECNKNGMISFVSSIGEAEERLAR